MTFRDVPREGLNEVREYLGSIGRAPSLSETVASDPQTVWRAQAGRGTVGAVAMGERVTAVATVDRWVYALDTRTGQVFWRYRGDNAFGVGPLLADGKVYAATEGAEGRLVAIRLSSGKRLWQTRVGDVAAPLTVRDTALYGATQDGRVFAVGTERGRMLWSRQIGGSRSGPLVLGDRIVVVTLSDTMVVLDRRTGAILTRAGLGASSIAPLAALDDSTVVVGSPAGRVLAVGVPSGVVRWRVETGDPVAGAPVVGRDTVFALTNRCTLWAIPVDRAASPDSASLGCVTVAGPTVMRDGVLVATVDGDLTYYDRRTRKRVWTEHLSSEIRHPPIVRNRQIVVAPTIGNVVSFR